jgi:hypothetical protein
MTERSIYNSTTLGPIPLSFTGRHLLQNLREAVTEMVSKAVEKAKKGQAGIGLEWDAVSRARGKLAQYMSQLEEKRFNPYPGAQTMFWLDEEPLDVAARRQEADTLSVNSRFGKFPPKHFGFDCAGNVRPDFKEPESAGDMLKRLGTDADLWAREFEVRFIHGPVAPNLDDLRAWFANAIEAGAIRESEKIRASAPYVLPPIPKGYELNIVGGIVSIAPIQKVKGPKK